MVLKEVLILQILMCLVWCEVQEETKIINETLSEYDRRFRPLSREEPVVVSVTFSVSEFGIFDSSKQSLRVLAHVRQVWQDLRLAFSSDELSELKLPMYFKENLWMPDIFFPDTKSVSSVSSLGEAGDIRISKNGTVNFFWLADIEASCPLNLMYFPFDVQTCRISISSYGYTRDDVKLKWQSGDALDAAPWLTMQNFFMVGKKAGQFYEYYDSGDSYSNLEANFYFQRLSFYYVMQFFFPAGVIVLISCASLWVPQCYVTLRMGFGLATILTSLLLCYLGNLTKNESSTITVCDFYLLVCFFYVFVIAARNFFQNICCGCCKRSSKENEMDDVSSTGSTGRSHRSTSSICDRVCGVLIPSTFVAFNLLVYYFTCWIRSRLNGSV